MNGMSLAIILLVLIDLIILIALGLLLQSLFFYAYDFIFQGKRPVIETNIKKFGSENAFIRLNKFQKRAYRKQVLTHLQGSNITLTNLRDRKIKNYYHIVEVNTININYLNPFDWFMTTYEFTLRK